MATNQSGCFHSDFYMATKVSDRCRKHWKDFRVPLDFYDDQGRCLLTLEEVLEFSFVCVCKVDFVKACSPSAVVYLKKRAELERRMRQKELRLEEI